MKNLLFSLLLLCTVIHPGKSQFLSWVHAVGVANNEVAGYAITTDEAGNIYTTGFFNNSPDFDPSPEEWILVEGTGGTLTRDVFVAKYLPDGTLQWVFQLGASWGAGCDLAIDSEGNLLVLGYYYGTADFDPGEGEAVMTISNADFEGGMFLAKYSAEGEYLSSLSVPINTSVITIEWDLALSLDSEDNVYVTGRYQGSVDFDPGEGTTILTQTNVSQRQGFVVKYFTDGSLAWAKPLTSSSRSAGTDIEVAGEVVYLTGAYSGEAAFHAGVDSLPAEGSSPFLAECSLTGCHLRTKFYTVGLGLLCGKL